MRLRPASPCAVWAVVWLRLASRALVFGKEQEIWGAVEAVGGCDTVESDCCVLIRCQGARRALWEKESRERVFKRQIPWSSGQGSNWKWERSLSKRKLNKKAQVRSNGLEWTAQARGDMTLKIRLIRQALPLEGDGKLPSDLWTTSVTVSCNDSMQGFHALCGFESGVYHQLSDIRWITR